MTIYELANNILSKEDRRELHRSIFMLNNNSEEFYKKYSNLIQNIIFVTSQNLGEAIHLGTELEDVSEIVPDKLHDSIEQIRLLNETSIEFNNDSKQHVFYKFNI